MEDSNTNIPTEIEANNTKKNQKKKRSKKGSKEATESPKTTIKMFFKEECKKDTDASTPLSAKKRSPPSTSKPQPKWRNKQDIDSEDSEVDSSMSEESLSDEEANKKKKISFSPELTLLKDILQSEIKSELDKSIDTKLKPLQTSLNSLMAKSTQSSISQPAPLQCEENLFLKIKCLKVERENSTLKHRVR